jgi:signal transduction histidine kinase
MLPARPADGPKTMSANKYASPDPAQRLGPLAAPRPAPGSDSAAPTLVQEKVLAEISHELGNFFHKLYYWSDYLQEKGTRRSPDVTATQMLERTIKNFEDFIRTALQYFNPIQLSCLNMPVAELIRGLKAQLDEHVGGGGTPVAVVDAGDWGDDAVMVDPGRFSYALEIAVRHLTQHVGVDSNVRVAIQRAERGGRSGVEIRFELHHPNGTSLLFQTAVAGVEWAMAEKLIELHGGKLAEHEDEHGARCSALFLPLATD